MEISGKIRVFEDAVAIVTGGASGIGRALAEELANRGCEVVLADRQVELAQVAASKICAGGRRATAANLDVRDFTAVDKLVRETVERAGRLDFMFNNAGIAIAGYVDNYGIDDWRYILDVNLCGVVNGVQAAYGTMLDQGFGHIVNTASMAGLKVSPGMVSYAATKYAIIGLSQSLRAEAASRGVRVSVLCPGVVRTPILEGGEYGRQLVELPAEKIRQMWEGFRPMAPERFAVKALDLVARNCALIIVPSWWKGYWWIDRLLPSLSMLLARKSFETFRQELAEAMKGQGNHG